MTVGLAKVVGLSLDKKECSPYRGEQCEGKIELVEECRVAKGVIIALPTSQPCGMQDRLCFKVHLSASGPGLS